MSQPIQSRETREFSTLCAIIVEGFLASKNGNLLSVFPIYYSAASAAQTGVQAAALLEQETKMASARQVASMILKGMAEPFLATLGVNLVAWTAESFSFSFIWGARSFHFSPVLSPIPITSGLVGVVAGAGLAALAGWYRGRSESKKN